METPSELWHYNSPAKGHKLEVVGSPELRYQNSRGTRQQPQGPQTLSGDPTQVAEPQRVPEALKLPGSSLPLLLHNRPYLTMSTANSSRSDKY
ncbi:hypothetical protein NDU88_003800 [Pleurodeles waltl]|uniref:Uncharacterized protein n=1 Tax=Pleurodeles waltl TaxID=8319 RepID=A0AAV7SGZ4_PLEWA|nr:hypothetical protein NDU88_003800 [Pleurodeles waltl]